jgi:hypothetical protein
MLIATRVWEQTGDRQTAGIEDFRCWQIVLQNDFAHPAAQDRFKIGRQCAMLIQKSMRLDSIVSNFYSTASARRLLQQYRHFCDITR